MKIELKLFMGRLLHCTAWRLFAKIRVNRLGKQVK